jgi:hypothetical protein
MSEENKSQVFSRRSAVSLLGVAAARAASLAGLGALGLAAPTTLLTATDAEAQTAGMTRRQERRTGRRERREARRTGRQERRATRRGTAPQ